MGKWATAINCEVDVRRVVVLLGQVFDLERVEKVLAGAEVRIIHEEGGFFLEAPEITQAADATEARGCADALARELSGLLSLEFTLATPLTAGSVIEIGDDGSRSVYGFAMAQAATAVAVAGMPTTTGDEHAQPRDRAIDVGLRQRSDPRVAEVAWFLAEGPSWVSIGKIIDTVSDDVGSQHLLREKNWIPKTDFRRITLTANAKETAREGGRHAMEAISLSKSDLSPITLDEAWHALTRLVNAWLSDRA